MSTSVLKLIPDDPTFVPEAAARQEAAQLLSHFLPVAREITAQAYDEVIFVDQGMNFEAVFCPVCHVEWTDSQWQDAMDAAYLSRFDNLSVVAPCCGTTVSLNDLRYNFPAGFARFVLQAYDPGGDVDMAAMTTIGDRLGCRLRKIWARY